MQGYRFHLQKYVRGCKLTCPSCEKPRCFTKYVDDEGEVDFPDIVGKCDHENSCGYHFTPKDYFQSSGRTFSSTNYPKQRNVPITCQPIVPSFIDTAIMEQSMKRYGINPLYIYLKGIFGEEETVRLFTLYHIGTSAMWGGATIYWQVDINDRVRTGKVMRYDPTSGHRVKEPYGYVSWAHAKMNLENYQLKQCLFGEHLLVSNQKSRVVIVESEKTAVIGTHFLPGFVWLATGGKNGCFNSEAMQVLKGREVILMPDLNATTEWRKKSLFLNGICQSVSVSGIIEEQATDEERKQGLDIADFLLMEDTPQAVLQKMIAKNPCLQKLIDTFKLELIE